MKIYVENSIEILNLCIDFIMEEKMIFNEINNVYYLTVSRIIKELLKKPLTDREMIDIIKETAFLESFICVLQLFLLLNCRLDF